MPIVTNHEARSTMYQMLKDALPGVIIRYEGIEVLKPAETSQEWVRITAAHIDAPQETLADKSGKKRYNNTGLVTIQCFGPLSDRGFNRAESLAERAKLAYRGKTGAGGIWFRNCRIREIGTSEAWYQFNTIIDFTYTQFS